MHVGETQYYKGIWINRLPSKPAAFLAIAPTGHSFNRCEDHWMTLEGPLKDFKAVIDKTDVSDCECGAWD